MGQMTKEQAIAILKKANPIARLDLVHIYIDAFFEYLEASRNIAENGTICAHPRTAAPMENPYLKVRNGAAATMSKIRMKADRLWERYSELSSLGA